MADGPLTLGTAVPLTIPVKSALRLRLKINNPSPGVQACEGHPLATQVVWGDPQLSP